MLAFDATKQAGGRGYMACFFAFSGLFLEFVELAAHVG